LDYLQTPIAERADWLIAHANFISEGDIAQLAASVRRGILPTSRRVAVAFCPRTHAFFAHPRHAYRTLLEAGVTVCLGTDSLASTPTLSILDEMRFLHVRDPSLPGATLLHMATLAGARALRRHEMCGSLAPGKLADLAVIRLPNRDDADPHRLLLESHGPVIRTMIGGRFAFQMK
jgi:cytosine/adenosine deaminase-related metal-dependent hydrolase